MRVGTMRALVKPAAGPGLEIRSVPIPKPGPGQVLVHVRAGGICGTDLHICERLQIIGVDRDGAFTDFVVLPAQNARKMPPAIPVEVAAVMDPLGNAVHTALSTDLAGRAVLVMGCGPIGLCAILVARRAGAAQIIAVDVNRYRLALAERLGPDLVLDARTEDVPRVVRGRTDGSGADVLLE